MKYLPKLRDVPFVTLLVGPDKAAYHVHRDMLCTASPVFNAAFEGNFIESSNHSMDLPDDDIDFIERTVRYNGCTRGNLNIRLPCLMRPLANISGNWPD